MQNEICKNQPSNSELHSQLPNQVVAGTIDITAILSDFFDSSGLDKHLLTLTDLFLAYTGHDRSEQCSRIEIANMVYGAELIKRFLIDFEAAYFSEHDQLPHNIQQCLETYLYQINVDKSNELICWSLSEWICINAEVKSLEDMGADLKRFVDICEFLRYCYTLNILLSNTCKDGGESC